MMCGLFAWFGNSYTSQNLPMEKMAREAVSAVSHRGPDSQTLWQHPTQPVFLGHTRLAITGKSGSQPLSNPENTIHILVNGEFYDFQALRVFCQKLGYVFKTDTDSEILIPLYLKYGFRALDYLQGEFAFILWDETQQLIWSVRDGVGVKPLRFYLGHEGLIFASEIQSIESLDIAIKWDHTALQEAFSLQYPRPDRSLFENIGQLEPGENVVWKKNQNVKSGWSKQKSSRYYKWFNEKPFHYENIDETIEKVLQSSVERRLNTHLPVAIHLSAGLDSSSLLAMAQGTGHAITAFGVGFDNVGDLVSHDESILAQQTAEKLGVDFVRVNGSDGDIVGDWIKATQHAHALAINGHIVGKWRLNQTISEMGFKVSMTGEGADEALLGYPHLKIDGIKTGLWSDDSQNILKQNIVSQGLMLPDQEGLSLNALQIQWGYIPTWIQAKASLGLKLRELLCADFKFDDNWLETWAADPLEKNPMQDRLPIHGAAACWATRAMGGYILPTLGDSMEGAFGIEGRTPFLDRYFLDLACSLEPGQTRHQNQEKAPLRTLLAKKRLGEISQRTKHPFQAPPLWSQPLVRQKLIERWSDSSFFERLPFISQQKTNTMITLLNQGSLALQQKYEPVVGFLLSLDSLSLLPGFKK